MTSLHLAFVIFFSLMILRVSSINGDSSAQNFPQEFCQFESFHPQCTKTDVIVMESATYGRMQIGKCITAKEIEGFEDDRRFLGCSVEVLSLLDEQCSGKTECEIRVYDLSNENRQPCFSGLKMYLEASYRCIRVADAMRSCAVTASAVPVHVNVSQNICGTESRPWKIEAPLGQNLAASIVDLTPKKSHGDGGSQCQQRGLIVDRTAKRNVSVCPAGSHREIRLFTSTGNSIEIFLNRQTDNEETLRNIPIFLKFEAVGCSDIVPSEDNWLKRRDDVIVIGCYSSRQTWQLNCINGKWVGAIGNCSKEMLRSDVNHESDSVSDVHLSPKAQVLTIVSICGFTLAICFIIVCIGALFVRRYYIQNKAKSDYRTLNYESDFGRSKELSGQKTSSAFPTHRTGDAVNGSLAHQLPGYSVYMGQDALNNTEKHHGQIDG